MTRRTFLFVPAMALPPPRTRLVFGGDVMLSRYVGHLARAKRDSAAPLRQIAPYLIGADAAFVNLESPFSDHGRRTEKGMVFRAEPEMIQALLVAGITVVSTANNHVRDCGDYGVGYTLDWLSKNGIMAVGTGHSREEAHAGAVLVRNGTRFGFLAYTYDQSNGNHPDIDERIAMLDAARMREDVASMKNRADVVIVSMHAGVEYQRKPNAHQREFAQAAIDAGAAIVVGHHPHVVQSVERYRDGVIFYSLGNLLFDQFQRRETQQGLLAEVTFLGARLERFDLNPVRIRHDGPRLGVF